MPEYQMLPTCLVASFSSFISFSLAFIKDRASLSFYNTREEIDIFIKALKETLDFFAGLFD